MKSNIAVVSTVFVSLTFLAFAGTARATEVFFDDFQDRPSVPAELPVVETTATGLKGDVADIGISWANETNNVDVVADPAGTVDSQVLQGNFTGESANGNIEGNLTDPILFDGASISVDFYLGASGNSGNDVTVRIRTAESVGTGGIQFNVDGSVTGAGNMWTINHFGTEVWQTAQWTYTSTGTTDEYDTVLTITDIGTGNSVNETTTFLSEGTDVSVFTQVAPLFRGNANHEAYIDNLRADGVVFVPEPSMWVLSLMSLLGAVLWRRR